MTTLLGLTALLVTLTVATVSAQDDKQTHRERDTLLTHSSPGLLKADKSKNFAIELWNRLFKQTNPTQNFDKFYTKILGFFPSFSTVFINFQPSFIYS